MADNTDRFNEVQRIIYDQVAESAPHASPWDLLRLAESFAWAASPEQSHGSENSSSS